MATRLLELLSKRVELRAQIGDFVAQLLRELFERGDAVRHGCRCFDDDLLFFEYDFAAECVRVSLFFLSGPAREARNRRQCLERGLNVGVGHQARRTRYDFSLRLRAAQRQHAQHRQFGAREIVAVREQVLKLRDRSPLP